MRACAGFDGLVRLVKEDARSDQVFARLEEAERSAAAAAKADPHWVDLLGGLSGLEVGFRENDAEASRLSLDVVRTACSRVRESPSVGE